MGTPTFWLVLRGFWAHGSSLGLKSWLRADIRNRRAHPRLWLNHVTLWNLGSDLHLARMTPESLGAVAVSLGRPSSFESWCRVPLQGVLQLRTDAARFAGALQTSWTDHLSTSAMFRRCLIKSGCSSCICPAMFRRQCAGAEVAPAPCRTASGCRTCPMWAAGPTELQFTAATV